MSFVATNGPPAAPVEAVHLLARQGRLDALQALYARNAALLTARSPEGLTPFLSACASGQTRVAAWLVNMGLASHEEREQRVGATGFHLAAVRNQAATLTWLLESRPDLVDVKTHDQATPLRIAAEAGYETVVTLLLSCGASPTSADDHGVTPAAVAHRYGHQQVYDIIARAAIAQILQPPVDVDAEELDAASAMDSAVRQHKMSIDDLEQLIDPAALADTDVERHDILRRLSADRDIQPMLEQLSASATESLLAGYLEAGGTLGEHSTAASAAAGAAAGAAATLQHQRQQPFQQQQQSDLARTSSHDALALRGMSDALPRPPELALVDERGAVHDPMAVLRQQQSVDSEVSDTNSIASDEYYSGSDESQLSLHRGSPGGSPMTSRRSPNMRRSLSATSAASTGSADRLCVPKREIGGRKKSYICDLCQKNFNCSSNLKRHMRIHTGQKPYQCAYCTKAFSNSSNRRKHERSCGQKLVDAGVIPADATGSASRPHGTEATPSPPGSPRLGRHTPSDVGRRTAQAWEQDKSAAPAAAHVTLAPRTTGTTSTTMSNLAPALLGLGGGAEGLAMTDIELDRFLESLSNPGKANATQQQAAHPQG